MAPVLTQNKEPKKILEEKLVYVAELRKKKNINFYILHSIFHPQELVLNSSTEIEVQMAPVMTQSKESNTILLKFLKGLFRDICVKILKYWIDPHVLFPQEDLRLKNNTEFEVQMASVLIQNEVSKSILLKLKALRLLSILLFSKIYFHPIDLY